jgi:hypothetical protein
MRAAAVFILTLGLLAPVFAQKQSGSLQGQVRDKTGKPLAGTVILVIGTSFQGQADAITPVSGRFHFPVLPPGTYELRADMPGYQSQVRQGLVIRIGGTTDVLVELVVSELEDDVAVVDPALVVDVHSAGSGAYYGSTLLTAIPTSRDFDALQNWAPGAISEGLPFARASSILGGSVRGQRYLLDGAPLSDPGTGYPMANLNVDIFEEVEIVTSGRPASAGPGDGAIINIVTKSGGNKAAGSLSLYLTGDALSKDLVGADAVGNTAVFRPEKFADSKDFSMNLGGPLWEDRAWYFLNIRRWAWTKTNPYAPESRMTGLPFSTGSHFDLEHGEWSGFAKLTLNATKQIRYSGMFYWGNVNEPVYAGSMAPDIAYDATWTRASENTYATTHQISFAFNPNTLLEIRGTYAERDLPLRSRDNTRYTFVDYSRGITWGAAPYSDISAYKRMSGQFALTWVFDHVLGADHEFKAGGEVEQGDHRRDWFRGNPYYSMWNDRVAGDPYYVDPAAAVGLLRIIPAPAQELVWHVQDSFRRFSAFVQDSAKTGRLALNFGLRFDYSLGFVPNQSRPRLQYSYGPENPAAGLEANDLLTALVDRFTAEEKYSPFSALTISYKKSVEFLTFSPRFGAALDLFGDGTTALKFSFSRDFEPMWTDRYDAGNIFAPTAVDWNWYDLNQDGLMDLPGIDEYVLVSALEQDAKYSFFEYVDASGQTHKLKAPYADEFSLGIERELFKDFKLCLRLTSRTSKNLVEDIDIVNGYDTAARDGVGLIWLPYTVTDPGRDGTLGNSDDKALTVYGLRSDRPAPVWKGVNPPDARRKYQAAALTFDKRMSNHWQLSGSVVWSSSKGNVGADSASTPGRTSMFNDPNSLTNAYGSLYFDRPLQVKVMAGYQLPLDFTVSAAFRFQSGTPYGRTLARVYFPDNYMGFGTRTPYVTVLADALGLGRYPATSNFDLRLERAFTFKSKNTLDVIVDVFNLLGDNGILKELDPSGVLRSNGGTTTYTVSPTYGKIISVYGARSFRIGLKYGF